MGVLGFGGLMALTDLLCPPGPLRLVPGFGNLRYIHLSRLGISPPPPTGPWDQIQGLTLLQVSHLPLGYTSKLQGRVGNTANTIFTVWLASLPPGTWLEAGCPSRTSTVMDLCLNPTVAEATPVLSLCLSCSTCAIETVHGD